MLNFRHISKSFQYAIAGIIYAFKNENNFRFHFILAIFVLLASWYFKITKTEWMFIVLTIVFVLTLELINTMFECMVDILEPRFHQYVKNIKDIMAAAVFVAALGAAVTGALIFAPRILLLL